MIAQQQLTEITTDPEGGYNVIDTRTGELLAWRGVATSAGEIVELLNRAYPPETVPPAHDTLVHEIIGARITGIAG